MNNNSNNNNFNQQQPQYLSNGTYHNNQSNLGQSNLPGQSSLYHQNGTQSHQHNTQLGSQQHGQQQQQHVNQNNLQYSNAGNGGGGSYEDRPSSFSYSQVCVFPTKSLLKPHPLIYPLIHSQSQCIEFPD